MMITCARCNGDDDEEEAEDIEADETKLLLLLMKMIKKLTEFIFIMVNTVVMM